MVLGGFSRKKISMNPFICIAGVRLCLRYQLVKPASFISAAKQWYTGLHVFPSSSINVRTSEGNTCLYCSLMQPFDLHLLAGYFWVQRKKEESHWFLKPLTNAGLTQQPRKRLVWCFCPFPHFVFSLKPWLLGKKKKTITDGIKSKSNSTSI